MTKFALCNARALLAKRFPHWYPVCSTRSVYHSCSYSLRAVFIVDRVLLSGRLCKPLTIQEFPKSQKTRIFNKTTVWLNLADSISPSVRSNSLHDGKGFDRDLSDCNSTLVKSRQRIKYAGKRPCVNIWSENGGRMSPSQADTLLQKAISVRISFFF
jgi:hypothetical protein